MTEGRLRLGTQGWNYPAWTGPLYPEGTRAADLLGVYSRAFGSVEVDSTFYATPAASAVRGWVERTPPGFVFALKLPREITHERRLLGVERETEEFFDRVRGLGDRLGPVLVQLGPDFSPREVPALMDFLPRLPADVRVAVEFRQHAWMTEATLDLLGRHGVALVLTDGPWVPRRVAIALLRAPTADFHYIRWMGESRDLTDFSRVQTDRADELAAWSEAILELRGSRPALDVFGFVSNFFSGHSPATVRDLQRRLGQQPVDPDGLREQTSLF